MIRAKDVVVLASLINVAVVALVLSTSVQRHSDNKTTSMRFEEPVKAVIQPQAAVEPPRAARSSEPLCLDEIDALLQEYEKGNIAETAPVIQIQSSQSSSEPSKYTLHTIQKGDSPWKIAKKYGMSFEELLKINGLDSKSAKNLKIGQTIKVVPKKQ